MRLIDADELKDKVTMFGLSMNDYVIDNDGIGVWTCANVGNMIDEAPTVEPKESVLVIARDEWKNIKQSIDDGDVSMIVIGDTVFRKGEVEKHGHWIDKPLPLWESVNGTKGECSVCHETDLFYSNYCPNCGAKMDEEVEE